MGLFTAKDTRDPETIVYDMIMTEVGKAIRMKNSEPVHLIHALTAGMGFMLQTYCFKDKREEALGALMDDLRTTIARFDEIDEAVCPEE